MHVATNAPHAVSANQNDTMSGFILVSWSPPAAGGADITGYRIYYTSGGVLMNVAVNSTEHQYQLVLGGALPDDMMLSIRAESIQLPSELITVTINIEVLATTAEELATTTTIAATTVTTSQATTTEITEERTTTGDEADTTTPTTPMAPTSNDDVMVTTSDDDIPTTTIEVLMVTCDGMSKQRIDSLLIIAVIEGITIVIMAIILMLITVVFLCWR